MPNIVAGACLDGNGGSVLWYNIHLEGGKMRPVVFIIRDGWGVNPRQDGNFPVPSEMTTPSLLAGKEPWSKTARNV